MAQFVKIGDDFLNLDNVTLVRSDERRVSVFFVDDGEEPSVIYHAEKRDALLAAVQPAPVEDTVTISRDAACALQEDNKTLLRLLNRVANTAPDEAYDIASEDFIAAVRAATDYLNNR